MSSPKCAILAIGTELTLGQITNRNASWLARELHRLGFSTPWHRCVPDDRELIESELSDLAQRCELLFITGGLGPTTDDFTRECVAQWLGRTLEWDEDSWNWIVNRFQERGITLRDFQKQQCFYPAGSRILRNEIGTAHGFEIVLSEAETQHKGKLRRIFVLPGPPAEVENVFRGTASTLADLFPLKDPIDLEIWDCLGVGESDIAHRVESVLEGCPFDKGYRVHLPYVEFKLSYPRSRTQEALFWKEKVDAALAPLTVLRQGEDLAERFTEELRRQAPQIRFHIVDELSAGILLLRLAPALKTQGLMPRVAFQPWTGSGRDLEVGLDRSSESPSELVLFQLRAVDIHEAEVIFQRGTQVQSHRLHSPYRSAHMGERQKQFFTESALLFWTQMVGGGLP